MSGNGGIDCIMLQSTVISTVKTNENDDCSDPPVTKCGNGQFPIAIFDYQRASVHLGAAQVGSSTISRFSSSFSQKTDSDSHDLWKLLCIYIIYRYVYIYIYNYIEYFWVPRCIHG